MVEAAAQTSETDSETKNTKTEAKARRARKPRKNATRVLTDEEAKAEAKAWCARALRRLAAHEKRLARAEAPKDEAARKAAEYDAWVRQKVKEALESAEFLTDEEMKAKAATWRAKAQQRRAAEARAAEARAAEAKAAEARRVADEVGMGECGRS